MRPFFFWPADCVGFVPDTPQWRIVPHTRQPGSAWNECLAPELPLFALGIDEQVGRGIEHNRRAALGAVTGPLDAQPLTRGRPLMNAAQASPIDFASAGRSAESPLMYLPSALES